MQVLIGNVVKTQFADYACANRELAEALFLSLCERERRAQAVEPPQKDKAKLARTGKRPK